MQLFHIIYFTNLIQPTGSNYQYPLNLKFRIMFKNDNNKKVYFPLHSDDEEDTSNNFYLHLCLNNHIINNKTLVRKYDYSDDSQYVYDLVFNKNGNIVENRRKGNQLFQDKRVLNPGDSAFVTLWVSESLLKDACFNERISADIIMDKMRLFVSDNPNFSCNKKTAIKEIKLKKHKYVTYRHACEDGDSHDIFSDAIY